MIQLAETQSLVAQADNVVAFPDGLPGFESCRRFLVVSPAAGSPYSVVQAVDPPQPSFLAIDPVLVFKRYRATLSGPDRLRLQAKTEDPLLWLAIVSLHHDGSASANLRAPLVINPRLMVGFQIVPHRSLYPIRQPLSL